MLVFPKLALIGHPIINSRSDTYHNYMLKRLGLDAHYEKFDLNSCELENFLDLAKQKGMMGLSVTMPFKEKILRLLDEVDETAKAITAVNTVHFMGGRAKGFNTDGEGALRAIQAKYYESLKGKKVIILGAGGAAKAIAWMFSKEGADLLIANRTPSKAKVLAEALQCESCSLEEVKYYIEDSCDILIQSTSVGMFDDQLILLPESIPKHVLVFDVISNPQNRWLESLAEKGHLTVSGKEMWIHQALAQYKIWYGDTFDVNLAREALELAMPR